MDRRCLGRRLIMKYKVILTESYRDINFSFSSLEMATKFIEVALNNSEGVEAKISIEKEGEE